MAYTIDTTEPTEFRGGDVVQWTKSLSDYLPATWTLIYTFIDAGAKVQVTCSDNGDDTHLAEMSIVNTQALDAASGSHNTVRWIARVNDGTDYHTVGTGTVKVMPDLAAASSNFDDRSHVKKTLDLINAVIEGSADRSYLTDGTGDRSTNYKTDAELIVMKLQYERWYKDELVKERIAQGLPAGNRIQVRF